MNNHEEYPCPGCSKPMALARAPILPCADCMEWFYEDLAHKIDPTYDKTKMNNWEDIWQILKKLWCFPPSRDGDNDKQITTTVAFNKTTGDNYFKGTGDKIRIGKHKVDEIIPLQKIAPLW